jgi:hypothetical protein
MKKYLSSIVPYPLHCFLVPVFFILHNYFYFYGLFDVSDLAWSIAGWLALPFVLILLFTKYFGSRSKACIFTTILLVIYFFSASLIGLIKTLPYIGLIGKYSISLPLLILLIYLFYNYIKKHHGAFPKLHQFFFLLFIVLIAVDLFIYIPKLNGDLLEENSFKTINRPFLKPVARDSSRPDIFFLVFDEHPSSSSVKRITGYDNSSLDSQLQRMGFNVSPNAMSGFSQTQPALCSLFDLGEYPYEANQALPFKDLYAAGQLLANNQLFTFLRNQNYRIINGSVFTFKQLPKIQTPKEWWGSSSDMISNQTIFNRVNTDIGWLKAKYLPFLFKNPIEKSIKADALLVESTKAILHSAIESKINQPKFVFGHFFLPHDPYKYDSTGKLFKGSYRDYLNASKTTKLYIEQLIYTRKLILEIASTIIQKNKRPSVIIIQGDHGLREYDRSKISEDEKFQILSAVYFPDKGHNQFTENHFAPNTFRIVLNNWFKQDLPLIKPWHLSAKK